MGQVRGQCTRYIELRSDKDKERTDATDKGEFQKKTPQRACPTSHAPRGISRLRIKDPRLAP